MINNDLYTALQNKDIQQVKKLIKDNNSSSIDYDAALRTSLMYSNNTEVVKLLLDNGADIHALNDFPLRWASRYGRTDTVKLLLDHGANIYLI